jgi:hypothetical protein
MAEHKLVSSQHDTHMVPAQLQGAFGSCPAGAELQEWQWTGQNSTCRRGSSAEGDVWQVHTVQDLSNIGRQQAVQQLGHVSQVRSCYGSNSPSHCHAIAAMTNGTAATTVMGQFLEFGTPDKKPYIFGVDC